MLQLLRYNTILNILLVKNHDVNTTININIKYFINKNNNPKRIIIMWIKLVKLIHTIEVKIT